MKSKKQVTTFFPGGRKGPIYSIEKTKDNYGQTLTMTVYLSPEYSEIPGFILYDYSAEKYREILNEQMKPVKPTSKSKEESFEENFEKMKKRASMIPGIIKIFEKPQLKKGGKICAYDNPKLKEFILFTSTQKMSKWDHISYDEYKKHREIIETEVRKNEPVTMESVGMKCLHILDPKSDRPHSTAHFNKICYLMAYQHSPTISIKLVHWYKNSRRIVFVLTRYLSRFHPKTMKEVNEIA